ncbi:MAG: hypothetical protein M1821_002355 [Bathelium mastoideum]|nr:MAG: hypothetical protein M1821_002355 [Bathelium mastoideum]
MSQSNTSPADLDLWHAYLLQLKDFFPFSDTDGSCIYVAPLTALGISVGQTIDQNIVNHDIFRIGDLLLPADSPVFLPGPSYSQRLLRFLQSVEPTPGRQDAVTIEALKKANENLAAETNRFLTCRRTAFQVYQTDPDFSTTTFDAWVDKFYPPYQVAQSSLNAASQIAFQASEVYYGPQADDLWEQKAMVSRAFSEKPNPPYNMPTSTAQVTQGEVVGTSQPVIDPADIKYEPKYEIDSTFSNLVTNWVINAKNSQNSPFNLTFSANSSTKATKNRFADVGFLDSNIQLGDKQVTPALPLFTASFNGQSSDVQKPSLAAGVGDGTATVTVTISASDAGIFAVSPSSSWNISDVTKVYGLRSDASEDLMEPLVLVSYILLGYQVSITIQTDSQSLFSQIDDGLARVKSLGGSATLLGLKVGPLSQTQVVGVDQITRDSKSQTITIPPRDNSQLTLIGLMGKKLGTPRRAAGKVQVSA